MDPIPSSVTLSVQVTSVILNDPYLSCDMKFLITAQQNKVFIRFLLAVIFV